MVTLNKIYTRTGDGGATRLATGESVPKSHARVEAYGAVDETNACLGLVRLHTGASPELDALFARIQNELFDLGADLATPEREGKALGYEPLRILEAQVTRLESDIDALNAQLEPLASFVLPAGSAAATHLHLARTVCRRAERAVVRLREDPSEAVSDAALKYLNRLSDLLFVAARAANLEAGGDVLWRPGATR
ncbi:MAG: cob(I)yrinic acid a,c-diamide adenosyltransferase [Pseudomonadota bacterium]|jgi:cob(I)alamin adenosyltransferase